MRILISTWSSRRVGGTETYLGRIMALLNDAGHDLAFCYEADEPQDRPPIPLPPGSPSFRVAATGGATFTAIRSWRPDVNYSHGLLDPDVEAALLAICPSVFFAHSYYGTCISGDKTHKFPVVQPCHRLFGPPCLALYFPRRCGGLSPVTMVTSYRRQQRRLELLRQYAVVLTHSEHMRAEFQRHGAAAGRVFNSSYTVTGGDHAIAPPRRRPPVDEPWRLLFIGRMERLKGGRALLDALPRTQAAIGQAIQLTFAGDGPARREWEDRAQRMTRETPAVKVAFAGWLQRDALAQELDRTDLVVVPSLWPEPFGLVGPEANRRGVPVVAYATGGIPEWLQEGVNGCLAPGDPPTVSGLSDALVRCLHSLQQSDALRNGALDLGHSRPDELHLRALVKMLSSVATGATPADT